MSRSRVLAEKLAAAVVCVAVMSACNAVTGAVAYAALDADVPNAGDIIAAGTTWVALEGLFFLALGAALASVLPRPELALHAGAALVCVAYAASVALDMFGDDAGWLRALSPIRYVRMNDVAAGAVSADGMAALVLLAVLGLAVALVAFRRRDL